MMTRTSSSSDSMSFLNTVIGVTVSPASSTCSLKKRSLRAISS